METKMRKFVVALVFTCFCIPCVVAQERREMGAHQHGHGTLNIAIEGPRVSLELRVPGDDIVGFEHAAKTKAQRAAVDKAKEQLAAPLALFSLPRGANCVVKDSNVKIAGGDEAKGAKDKGTNHDHSEFHADYTLECSAPQSLKAIEFPYFRIFKGAQELDVSIITPKGQSKFEVTRRKPRVDLSSLM
jgi:hypothetical protein